MSIILKNKHTLKIEEFYFKCCVGKGGLSKKKIEGDKKTPIGTFAIENLYFRKDRIKKPQTSLKCIEIIDQGNSWIYVFEYSNRFSNYIIEKGSICINGVSLTCFDVKSNIFSVAIIPHTYNKTNFKFLNIGDIVNLEFDMVGKYINKIAKL